MTKYIAAAIALFALSAVGPAFAATAHTDLMSLYYIGR